MLNKPVVLLGLMMLDWLVSYLLWISLVLLLASALTREQPHRSSRMGALCILLARPDRALSGHRGLLQCGSLFGGRSLELLHGLDCDEQGLFIKGMLLGELCGCSLRNYLFSFCRSPGSSGLADWIYHPCNCKDAAIPLRSRDHGELEYNEPQRPIGADHPGLHGH